jgi:hypothetical protein
LGLVADEDVFLGEFARKFEFGGGTDGECRGGAAIGFWVCALGLWLFVFGRVVLLAVVVVVADDFGLRFAGFGGEVVVPDERGKGEAIDY